MKKLVVLKLNGDIHLGAWVTLEIGPEGARPETEATGSLPQAPELVTAIKQWHSTYRSIVRSARIIPQQIIKDNDITELRQKCLDSSVVLRKRLNDWLLSDSFRPLRETWLNKLDHSDSARVLIRTSDQTLRQLPWDLWDLVERYPFVQVVLSAPEFEQPAGTRTPTDRERVRILAILGNSTGINVQKDRQLLENLPNADTTFLVEPLRQEINNQLCDQPWDILFFAGHSRTKGNTGYIDINKTDSLNLDQLRYALKKAIGRGLQLAIFNSCEGLGLAGDLEQLQIPQIIVMREPVPDRVAQEFLKNFLLAFAAGNAFHLAVRQARQRLQALEDEFPAATLLPVICQHPAAEPLTWQGLGGLLPCPYRGLSAFAEQHAPVFKGRESATQELVSAVGRKPLLAVIGPSGSGKTSVVFAGLIPRLRQLGNWHIAHFRPGSQPFKELATVLLPLLESETSHLSTPNREFDVQAAINALTATLRQSDRALLDIIERIWQQSTLSLLLVADQFEELYTLCQDDQELEAFLDALLKAVKDAPKFSLVLTLRADFYGYALSYRPLADALQDATFNLGPMNPQELEDAIALPAAQSGVQLQPGLTKRLIDEVVVAERSEKSARLPLLEFALEQMWKKQSKGQLTHQAYNDIGGVEESLGNHAEAVYGRFDSADRLRTQRVFIQLVQPGEGTEDTKRLATRTEVGENNWDLVTRLASERLVVSDRHQVTGEETVEIVHEALIRGWGRLQQWMKVDRVFRSWQERLRAAMRQWEASNNDDGALLQTTLLAEAEGWLQQRYDEISPDERVFIQMSLGLRDRLAQEQEEQRQRELRQERKARKAAQRLIRFVTIFAAMLIVVASFAFNQWRQAQHSTINALAQTSEASLLVNRQLESLVAAVQSGKQLQNPLLFPDANASDTASAALQRAFSNVQERNRLEGHSDPVNSVVFSPDGKTLASGSSDNTIKLWNVAKGTEKPLKGHSDPVNSVVFSPDGKTLASGSSDNTIKLWNVAKGTEITTLKGHSSYVSSVVFSPDGKTLASGSDDNTIKLWDVAKGTQFTTLKGHSSYVSSVVFSPDGKTLASGSDDDTIKLWDVAKGTEITTLKGDRSDIFRSVSSVVFSPDGKTLASGSYNNLASDSFDNTIKLWDVAKGTEITTLEGHSSDAFGMFSVVFSPDGKTLASGNSDNTIKLWDVAKGTEITTLKGHSSSVNSVVFSPDGKTLASGSDDNTIKLWDIAKGTKIITVKGDSGLDEVLSSVNSVVFSPDGKTLASGSSDNTIKLWDIAKGTEITTLKGHSSEVFSSVNSVVFSPDGKTLAFGNSHNTIKLWDIAKGTEITTVKGDSSNVFRSVNSVVFSPDGKTFASDNDDNTIKLWDVAKGTEITTLKGHSSSVRSLVFGPDSKTLASGSSDNTIKLWDIAKGTEITTLKGHSSLVSSVVFSPDGKTLASGSYDKTIKLWNVAKGTEITTLKGHSSSVSSVVFSPDGKTLASGSSDNTIKLWDVAKGTEITTLKGHSSDVLRSVNSVVFSPDGKTLASNGGDNTIKLWNFYPNNLNDLMTHSCDWLRGYLQTNPNVSDRDRTLCDGIGTQK